MRSVAIVSLVVFAIVCLVAILFVGQSNPIVLDCNDPVLRDDALGEWGTYNAGVLTVRGRVIKVPGSFRVHHASAPYGPMLPASAYPAVFLYNSQELAVEAYRISDGKQVWPIP